MQLIVAAFLVAQLSAQTHVLDHETSTDSTCISCTLGGTLTHAAGSPDIVIAHSVALPTPFDTGRSAAIVDRHHHPYPARAPPTVH